MANILDDVFKLQFVLTMQKSTSWRFEDACVENPNGIYFLYFEWLTKLKSGKNNIYSFLICLNKFFCSVWFVKQDF